MDKFLSISTIFKIGSMFGLLTGIALMYLLNGVLGHASIREGIVAFLILQGLALIGPFLIFKRLQNIWSISVQYPIPRPSPEDK